MTTRTTMDNDKSNNDKSLSENREDKKSNSSLNKKKKGKGNNVVAKGNVPGLKYTVFVEDGIIDWEFKKG